MLEVKVITVTRKHSSYLHVLNKHFKNTVIFPFQVQERNMNLLILLKNKGRKRNLIIMILLPVQCSPLCRNKCLRFGMFSWKQPLHFPHGSAQHFPSLQRWDSSWGMTILFACLILTFGWVILLTTAFCTIRMCAPSRLFCHLRKKKSSVGFREYSVSAWKSCESCQFSYQNSICDWNS